MRLGLSLGLGYEKREKYRLDGADINQDSFVTTLTAAKELAGHAVLGDKH